MDLWIRSQDKRALELVHSVEIAHKQEHGRFGILDKPVKSEECYIFVNGSNFGEYKNEQRAIEVLNKIQKLLVPCYIMQDCNSSLDMFVPSKGGEIKVLPRECVVYQIPADDEVEKWN